MKKIKNWIGIFFLSLLFGLLRLLPRKWVQRMGGFLGCLAFRLAKKQRKIALKNLDWALGREKNDQARREIARRAFSHFGSSFFDLIHLSGWRPQDINHHITSSGMEHFRAALEKGRGVLLFTAHFGSWEIAPSLINQAAPLSVVARPLDNPYLEKKLAKLRQAFGSCVISKFEATRHILRTLRDNEIVAILIDQNVIASEAVFVDYFGRKAATTPGLALFHLRTGAALIPAFCYPETRSTYHLEVSSPLDIPLTGDSEQDILNITQACTEVIEAQVRKMPEYWLWFHDRWKTRPTLVPEKN